VNRSGTSRGRVNPSYTWYRTTVDNCLYHAQFGLPLNTSVVPLEYMANHSSLDDLTNLSRRIFRVRPDFYGSTTACSKGFLLTEVIAGTSPGIQIVDLVSTYGNMVFPFIKKHEATLVEPFPSAVHEMTTEYAHYPYPPIRDPQARSSCVGFYS
jgi:hypothetical protein